MRNHINNSPYQQFQDFPRGRKHISSSYGSYYHQQCTFGFFLADNNSTILYDGGGILPMDLPMTSSFDKELYVLYILILTINKYLK